MKEQTSRRFLILGLLLEGTKHGYELHRSHLLRIWGIPMSQLYNLLKRLEKEGLVQASVEMQENRPGRKTYALTEAGRLAFLDWVQSPVEKMRDIRTEFLAKLYMVYRLNLGIGKRLVQEQVRVCERRREMLAGKLPGAEPFEALVQRYRLTMIDATIGWLATCEDLFGERGDAM